jgi:putative transcriptional regulator
MGIIFNRPSPLFLGEILAQLDYDFKGERSNAIVYEGGPVQQDRGFVLHTDKRKWQSNLSITEDMHLTTSKDILEAIADNDGPDTFLIALGYAGWGSGQLEKELIENTWLTCQAETDTLFHTENGDKFAKAVGQLGIDINQLSSQTGHA